MSVGMNKIIIVVFGVSLLLCAPFQTKADNYQWIKEPGRVALQHDERIVWAFNYGPEVTKPYFHPITLTDNTVITRFQPKSKEHPWHKGLWFSFKYINGVNYWEENKKTWGIGGLTKVVDIDVKTKKDDSATISLTLAYTEQSGKEMVIEKRKLYMSSPDTQDNFHIDWHSTFTAQQDVELGRTPLPNEVGGKSFGGYAGYSFRVAEHLRDEWLYLTSEQQDKQQLKTNKQIHRTQQNWIYSGGKQGGIVLFDHPENGEGKTHWYVGGQHYFSPAFLHQANKTYKQNDSWQLQYRAKVFNKPSNSAVLNRAYVDFTRK